MAGNRAILPTRVSLYYTFFRKLGFVVRPVYKQRFVPENMILVGEHTTKIRSKLCTPIDQNIAGQNFQNFRRISVDISLIKNIFSVTSPCLITSRYTKPDFYIIF